MEGFSESPAEAYKFEPIESLELYPGDVLAIMINIEGVTAAFKDPFTTVDHFGALLNTDRMALIERSSVATRDPAIYEYPVVKLRTTTRVSTTGDTTDTTDTTTPDDTADEDTTTTPDDTADETTATDDDTTTPADTANDGTTDTTTPASTLD